MAKAWVHHTIRPLLKLRKPNQKNHFYHVLKRSEQVCLQILVLSQAVQLAGRSGSVLWGAGGRPGQPGGVKLLAWPCRAHRARGRRRVSTEGKGPAGHSGVITVRTRKLHGDKLLSLSWPQTPSAQSASQ